MKWFYHLPVVSEIGRMKLFGNCRCYLTCKKSKTIVMESFRVIATLNYSLHSIVYILLETIVSSAYLQYKSKLGSLGDEETLLCNWIQQ